MNAAVNVIERLHALGLVLPQIAQPVGAYVPAHRSGDLIYTSGQLPFVDGKLEVTGKVGPGLVDADVAADLARTAALNAVAAVAAVLAAETGKEPAEALSSVVQVVKVTGFVASTPEFTGQPAVLNGASNLLQELFGAAGVHARSAVGVAVLPLDSPVEVEIVVRTA